MDGYYGGTGRSPACFAYFAFDRKTHVPGNGRDPTGHVAIKTGGMAQK